MFHRLAVLGARVGVMLRRGVSAVFGDVSWQPPGWLRFLAERGLARPARSALLLLLSLLALFGGRYAYHHRRIPVPPRYIHATVTAPEIIPLYHPADLPPLTIRFDEGAAALSLLNKPLAPALIRLDPPQPGTWRWLTDRSLVFAPTADWPAGQSYHVTVSPTALGPNVRLASYTLDTRTPVFTLSLEHVEFYQNPADPSVRQVTATIVASHPVDPAELERHLSLEMLGGSPVFGTPAPAKDFTLLLGRRQREFFLRSVPLTLPAEPDTMKLRLTSGVVPIQPTDRLADDQTATVGVPALDSLLRIESATTSTVKNKEGDPEQLLFVETSCLAHSEDIEKFLALYALPAENPARRTERHSSRHDAADNDHGQPDSDDEDANSDSDSDNSEDDPDPPTDHDGRYHTAPRPHRDDEDSDDDDSRSDTNQTAALTALANTASDPWSPDEVDAVTLARARRVSVTVVASHDETSTTHTFRLRADAPGFLFVKINQGAPAPGGYRLRDDYEAVVPVPIPEREVNIQGDGGVLALSGERKLSVQSRGVSAIRYEIARVPAGEINHLASQTEGSFQNPAFRNRHFNEQDLAHISTETQTINLRNPVEANYSTFDFTGHLQPTTDHAFDQEGLFFLTASGFDPQTNKYIDEVQSARFVLVTDLGLLVKRNADGSRDVFAASLGHGTPLGSVSVTILARNGAVLADAITDEAGRASLPSLGKNPRDSHEPVAIVARLGNDVSFLPYERNNRELDFSRFPIDGVENRTGHELDAFVFTERGVYRPGDTLHVGVIVKQRDWNGAFDGLPLETEVIDAREQLVQVKPLTLPASGFVEWTFDTTHESPTGGYTLNVYLQRNGKRGTLLGSASVQVKEFLPDRLKLDVSLSRTSGPGSHGWVAPDGLKGIAALKNLYGTAAENRLIKSHLRLNPRGFSFKEYPEYTFFDPLHEAKKDWEGETIDLGDQQTTADGTATFEFDLHRFADATYRLTFDAEGFEAEGGRGVEDLTGTLVSPLPSVVGWHADGDLNWIKAAGPSRTVDFVGITPALQRIPLENLTLHLAELQWVSVLTKDNGGSYRYESVRREHPLRDEPFRPSPFVSFLTGVLNPLFLSPGSFPSILTASDAPVPDATFLLPNSNPGTFILELRNGSGQTVTRLEYTVVGQGEVTRSLEKNAELEIHLAKDQYNAGDEIEIAITSPYTGSGLITLERERVYTHKWFTATGTSSVQKITIPPDFDGTGYVNVSFVRALDSKEIFMSPLSYAVAPFTANLEHRRLRVDLQAVAKTKPGEPLTIHYRTDRPAKIAIFAVDQGILQVTKFSAPDPLGYQFRKSALNVRTSQIVDLLLPEFSLLRAAQSVGGDGDPGVLNPFRRVTEKPVVYWSGILDADGTERTVTYPVPDYFNGTLTLMAVAVAPDALGSTKTSTLCRSPFVLTPGVPTLAAPGDEFEVGLTVANGSVGSGPDARITVQAQPSSGLEIVRAPTEPLRVPEGHEASTVFRVRALDRLGSAQIGFQASGHGEDSRVHATLSIRPAMPLRTVITSGRFTGPTKDTPVQGSDFYTEYRQLDATVASLPLGLARGLQRYLQEYPHGCSEQITSGAFARLALAGEPGFDLARADAAAQIEHTIAIERRRQNDAGGFGFWDASKTPDIDFITVYVMHFLSEAKADGYPVPDDMFQKGIGALRRASTASPWSLQQARTQAYALYLLSREGIVVTNQLLTLRDYLDTYYKDQWPHDLTAVYLAGSWSLLKKDDEARRLIDGYQLGRYDDRERSDFYQPLIADAQYVTMVARHFPDKLRQVTHAEFSHVTQPIAEGDYSTLCAAYAVLALKAYSQAALPNAPKLSAVALLPKSQEKLLPLEGTPTRLLSGAFPPTATSLRFRADGGSGSPFGVFFQTAQSGFARTLPIQPIARGIEVLRDILDAEGKLPVARVKLGERVTVRVRLRAIRALPVTNVAVLDLLPGGFEVADDSLKPGVGTAGMDYVDVREDRAVFYGTATNTVREITYRLKPTARGEFTVPPIFAQSMYDKQIESVGVAGHLTVSDAK